MTKVREQAMVQSIHPLDGGYGGYIETLEDIRSYIDSEPASTREDLRSWYCKKYGPGNATTGINSLFRSGLLAEDDGHIECMFPKGRSRNRRVVKIINDHVVYVLDMLNEARNGATYEYLHDIGKTKYGLSDRSNINQIWWRRGWLESAKVLEDREGQFFAADLGRKILDEHFGASPRPRTRKRATPKESSAEFGGKGEGVNHRTLKEYVCNIAEKVCRAKLDRREVEYRLPSGDEVDVTAWNARTIWHIEVKSRTSKDPDLKRGLYQCVKYGAVGKAMEKADDSNRKVKSLLVVESKLSKQVRDLADELDIHVYELTPVMRCELKNHRADLAT